METSMNFKNFVSKAIYKLHNDKAVASKINVVRPKGKNIRCVMMLDHKGCKILGMLQ